MAALHTTPPPLVVFVRVDPGSGFLILLNCARQTAARQGHETADIEEKNRKGGGSQHIFRGVHRRLSSTKNNILLCSHCREQNTSQR